MFTLITEYCSEHRGQTLIWEVNYRTSQLEISNTYARTIAAERLNGKKASLHVKSGIA